MSVQGTFMIFCAEQYKMAKHYIIEDIDLYIETRKSVVF